MQIGPYTFEPALALAPMAGVTDRPFRQLCRRLGAGWAVAEMLSSDTRLWSSRKSQRRLNYEGEPSPRVVQIAGADPQQLALAAQRCVELGADIIDINMGCPAKKVCNVAAGSALLRDEPLVGRILHSVVHAVSVPVTLKIRTGWDAQQRNGLQIAQIAQDCGIQALAVHGRTRADLYTGQAEYHTIAQIKQALQIPVIANGDIDSALKARAVLQQTQADGLMIGRAAQGYPWIFREIAHFLRYQQLLAAPTHVEVRDILLEHLQNLYSFSGEQHGVYVARKHLAWYCQAHPDAVQFRQQINALEHAQQQLALTQAYFDRLSALAA